MQPWAIKVISMRTLRIQNLVIGSGPGGSVTALELQRSGFPVLLLEEGAFLDQTVAPLFSQKEQELKYRNLGLTTTFGQPKISYVEGRVSGGGSEINAGLYHRTPEAKLQEWKNKFELQNADSKALGPYYDWVEKTLEIGIDEAPPLASLKLKEGADKLGWGCIEVPRWYKRGQRNSMTKTLINEYLQLKGEVLFEARALKVSRASKLYWEVKVQVKDQVILVEAENVFLCGGAIQSTLLLKRSGFSGPIGERFQVHPTIKVIAEFKDQVNFENQGVPFHQVKEFSPHFSFGCSISSKSHLSLGLIDHPHGLNSLPEKWHNMSTYYAMICPEGTGRIFSLPLFKDAFIHYKLTPQDYFHLSQGLRSLMHLLREAGAVSLYPSLTQYKEGQELNSEVIRSFARLMTIHLFSSMPAGENKKICVTDSYGSVHGHRGLYVNDGSILCSAPSVNPQGTIMALAKRNIEYFLKRSR